MNKFLKRLKTPGNKLKRYCFLSLALPSACIGQTTYDLANEKVLFVVATAHLDTQWRWTIQKSIDEYLKKTLDDNFTLLEKYPDYTFNFEGAFRYMLMKEYYPERYAKMSEYIAQGRWRVAGSTVEQGDMNIVSPESLIRQTLLGNNYFEDEFGKRSTDIYLPDCFGFSYSMPTWMAHCGLNGFSTAKLAWGSSVGIPFDIGIWKGPDGSSVIAALNPGAYSSNIENDLSKDAKWINRINALGKSSGVYAGFKYFGVGDTGGAPSDESCQWLTTAMADTSSIKVVSAGTDDLFNSITTEQKAALPVYNSELLMSKHGVGCYTAQAALKRWNRQNELLADSTERVAAFADIFNAVEYPTQTLNEAWTRFLWHSFHDDLTGTSIPEAYHYSWNDEIISQNQFASILTNSVASLAPALNTKVKGTPIIAYNPLAIARTGIIEATVGFEKKVPDNIKVYDGKTELPAQIIARDDKSLTIAFIGTVPSVGLKVFDVQVSRKPCQIASGITVSASTLENSALRVSIDTEGNISSIFDKINNKEVLSDTCRLELLDNYSEEWPAWEIMPKDVMAKPYAFVRDSVKVEIAENGPARAALLISRKYGDSTFLQKISLCASGLDSQQVTIENLIDWRTRNTLLKASFPLSASNEKATYDLGMGTIQRKNNTEKLFEVPAQQWADITTPEGEYGVSVFSDSKYGWDKPSDNTLRLTLMHSPKVKARYMHGSSQDIGQHKFTYAIAPHAGNWNTAQIPQQAAAMNQPTMAFQTDKHPSAMTLGSELSLVKVSDSQAFVKAVKKAQRSDELIVRVQELYGKKTDELTLSIFGKIKSASIVDGCERYIADARLENGKIAFSLKPYEPMTFALTLEEPALSLPQIKQKTVSLPYNLDAFSYDTNRSDGNFHNEITYPAELLGKEIIVDGISFMTGDTADGQLNALVCNGQTIQLDNKGYKNVYFLAAARGKDTSGTFNTPAGKKTLTIQDYNQKIVDWGSINDIPYLKQDQIAWVGTHSHNPTGNISYEFCNMFMYKIALDSKSSQITLPDNNNIVIFAATLADKPSEKTIAASGLIDSLPYIPELAPKPEMRENLALNKKTWASGNVDKEPSAMAVDGTVQNNSKWCCTGNKDNAQHWLAVDLESEYLVDTFVIKHAGVIKEMLEHGRTNSRWNTVNFSIQTSPDGQNNWKDLICVQDNTDDISRHCIAPVKARFLRLYITTPARDDDKAARIFEFEVYGQTISK